MEENGNDLIGVKEAAKLLNLSASTVQRYCRQGKFGQDAMQDAPEHPWHIRRDAVLRLKERRKTK